MNVFARLIRVSLVAVLAAASPVAFAHDEDDGPEHHHHHGPVVQPRNFDHAVDLVRDGLERLGVAVSKGDMHALHELSDGVVVPARAFGKLAAARPGAAPANIRAINTLGQDIATLVDAMHVAADSSKADVVVAKWKEIEMLVPQLDAVAPVPQVSVVWVPQPPSETGRPLRFSNPGQFVVTLKDISGAAIEPPTDGPGPDLYAVSEDFVSFSHTRPQRRAAGEYTSAVEAPYWGMKYTTFVMMPVPGRPEPYTKRLMVDVPGNGGSAPDYSGPLNSRETSRTKNGYLVRLNGSDHIHAGETVALTYLIDQTSNPGGVNTEDYLGLPAFFSAISEDQRTLVRASNVERAAKGEVRVTALFPQKGRYVTYLEFKHAGKVTIVAIAIEVHDAL